MTEAEMKMRMRRGEEGIEREEGRQRKGGAAEEMGDGYDEWSEGRRGGRLRRWAGRAWEEPGVMGGKGTGGAG